jgi:arabinofuranosyltransferase
MSTLADDAAMSANPSLRPSASRAWSQRALVAAPLALLAALGWTHRWITDDGFIYLRVVRQLEAGNGPVYNAGQRVEAFTSPLWVATLWLFDALTPVRLEWLAVGLGILLTVLGLAFGTAGAAQLVRRDTKDALLVPVGGALLVSLVPMWCFASGGLETGLVFAWLGACLWALAAWARSPDRRLSAPAAILIGLGWIVRPELALYSAAFVTLVVAAEWRSDGWRQRLRLVGLSAALPAIYQLFRMGYYGSLVTNTAIAKEASLSRWDIGWLYLQDFVEPYRLWLPLAFLALGAGAPLVAALRRRGERRSLFVMLAFSIAAVCNVVYIVRVGGDYLHARLFLPALFAVCIPVAVVPATRRYLVASLVVGWSLICAVGLRPPQLTRPRNVGRPFVLPPNQQGSLSIEGLGWNEGGRSRTWYTGPALYHLEHPFFNDFHRLAVEPDPSVHLPTAMLFGIGLTGYAMGPQLDVLDLYGLADALGARFQLSKRGYMGHEKSMPAPWMAARLTAATSRPPASEFPAGVFDLIPPTTGARFDEQVAWARAALKCPALVELEQSTTAPLTAARFFRNLAHAFAHTRLRIPPDPEAAYRRFCGPGARDLVGLKPY